MVDAVNSIASNPSAITLQSSTTDSLSSSSDVDYYKVPATEIPSASLLTVDFTGLSSSTTNDEYKISIVSADDTELATDTQGVSATLTYQVSASTPYYIKVEEGDTANTSSYSIVASITSTSEVEGTNGNDSQVRANHLLENVSFTGSLKDKTTGLVDADDIDVYAFTTNEAGSDVLVSVTAGATSASTFYSIKLTDHNGQTIKDSNQTSQDSTVAGNAAGSLAFTVTESSGGTPQGTYFLHVWANDADTFATSEETGLNYTIALAGTSVAESTAGTHDYNTAPVVTVGGVSSGASQKDSSEALSVNIGSYVSLSDVVSVSDADGSSTTNGTMSSYVVGLYDTSTPVTYSGTESTYDGYISYGDTPSYVVGYATQGAGFLNALTAAEFATAKYYAGTSANTQKLYVYAIDSSGSSSLSGTSMAAPLDTSGIVTVDVATTDASVSVVSAGVTDLKEGNTSSTYTDTLTISVDGDTQPGSGTGSVVVVLDPGDDLDLSGVTASNAVTLNADNSYTAQVTVTAKSDAITELVEAVSLSFTTNSTDSAFDNLAINSQSYIITEQVASFSVGTVTYSDSNTSVLEGDATRIGSYTVTASDIPVNSTLTVNVAGGGVTVTSDSVLSFIYSSGNDVSNTVTFVAEDDSSEEDSPHAGTLSHTVVDGDGNLVSSYTGAIGDASASITDNDDETAPSATVSATTISSAGNAVVQSSETGTAYLVNSSVTVSTLEDITGAADDLWNTATVAEASTNTNLAATGLADGTYKAYTVDAAGNFSTASSSSVVIDSTAPTMNTLVVSVDDIIDSSDDLSTVAFSGTTSDVDNGEMVSVTIADITQQVAVSSDAYSGTVDLSGLTLSNSLSARGGIVDGNGDSTLQVSNVVTVAFYDALVVESSSGNSADALDGLSLNLWKDGADTGTAMTVSEGEISIGELITFDAIKLPVSDSYTNSGGGDSINITDAISILRDIVGITDLTGAASQAADVNNDSSINITDAIGVLRHIVGITTIDTFDLVDSDGALVSSLAPLNSGDAPVYTLVMNGDVDASGSFSTDYITAIDIV
jgi:hypothetical protein